MEAAKTIAKRLNLKKREHIGIKVLVPQKLHKSEYNERSGKLSIPESYTP